MQLLSPLLALNYLISFRAAVVTACMRLPELHFRGESWLSYVLTFSQGRTLLFYCRVCSP